MGFLNQTGDKLKIEAFSAMNGFLYGYQMFHTHTILYSLISSPAQSVLVVKLLAIEASTEAGYMTQQVWYMV